MTGGWVDGPSGSSDKLSRENVHGRVLRGSLFNQLGRLVFGSVCYIWSIWFLTDDPELWQSDPVGTAVWTGLVALGLIAVTRFVLAAVILSEQQLVARGILRTRTIARADVVALETRPFRGSVLVDLRLVGGKKLGLPWGVQGGIEQMAEFRACLEAWHRGPLR